MHQATPDDTHHWVAIWSTAIAPVQPMGLDQAHAQIVLHDTTIRQTFRVTLGAERIRLIISNEYGDTNLNLSGLTVAQPAPKADGITAGSPSILPHTNRFVTIGGRPGQVIPPGSTAVTDTIALDIGASVDLSVSLYLAGGQETTAITGHYVGKTDTWLQRGNASADGTLSSPSSLRNSFYVACIEGWVPRRCRAVACFGDSITDRGDSNLPYNEYVGWIDGLSARLNQTSGSLSVLNLGISGDQVFAGGLARFDHDAILQAGVKFVFLHMGVNDIGITPDTDEAQDALFHRLVYAYQQIATKSKERGLTVIGSTVMPFLAPPDWPTPWPFVSKRREVTRQRINAWILAKADFHHVVDFSSAVTDPNHPEMIRKEYQVIDYLHPSAEGYSAMVRAIDLGLFYGGKEKLTGNGHVNGDL